MGRVCGRKCELRRLVKLQKLLQFLPSVPYWRRDLKRRSYSKQIYICGIHLSTHASILRYTCLRNIRGIRVNRLVCNRAFKIWQFLYISTISDSKSPSFNYCRSNIDSSIDNLPQPQTVQSLHYFILTLRTFLIWNI